MASKEESSSFSKRLAQFAARFESKPGGPGPAGSSTRFRDTFIRDLRDLFTRDISRAGMRDLVKRDARETLRFYLRTVDFESTRSLPWYKRYPQAAWKVFVALAYRLSPPRRIAFALAVLALVVGWIELIIFRASVSGAGRSSGALWLAVAFVIIFMLLFIELRDKLDLKGDLEIAREIQFGLVPSEPFRQDGIAIHYDMRPANTVGGDYYDIIKLEEKRVGVLIGDVSGKGMPAALLMALLMGSLRTLTTAGLRKADLITKLNQYLCANIPQSRLITLFYGELDTTSGLLSYINAGHNAPFLMRREGGLERLPATSIVLGFTADTVFEAKDISIQPGETLLLYTDGITEAFNEKEEEYGEARLATFLQGHATAQPPELVDGLVKDVLAFCNSARPTDDITLMLITRQALVSA